MARTGHKVAKTSEESGDDKVVANVSRAANRRPGKPMKTGHRPPELIMEVLESFGSLTEPARRSIVERLFANL
jgi:hypothetical protein